MKTDKINALISWFAIALICIIPFSSTLSIFDVFLGVSAAWKILGWALFGGFIALTITSYSFDQSGKNWVKPMLWAIASLLLSYLSFYGFVL